MTFRLQTTTCSNLHRSLAFHLHSHPAPFRPEARRHVKHRKGIHIHHKALKHKTVKVVNDENEKLTLHARGRLKAHPSHIPSHTTTTEDSPQAGKMDIKDDNT